MTPNEGTPIESVTPAPKERSLGFTYNAYNRMMIRDVGLIALAVILVLGLIFLLAIGKAIPGEMWGMVSAVIAGIVGSMGRYNGHDAGMTVPRRS